LPTSSKPTSTNFEGVATVKHEASINRSLRKRNPMLFPRDIDNYESREPFAPTAPPENEPYALGHDARMDGKSIDENPYPPFSDYDFEHRDWAIGWFDADRALDEDDDEGD
jgi:hypothetical protein